MTSLLTRLAPLASAAAAAVAIAAWLSPGPAREYHLRGRETDLAPVLPSEPVAGPTTAADGGADRPPLVPLPGKLVAGEAEPATELPGSWPCFRGEDRDGVAEDSVPLLRDWPEDGPEVLWSLDVGDGYAGAAVDRGRLWLLDYDFDRKADVLRCLSLADGGEIWRRWYSNPIRKQHGLSRTVPAVAGKYVVSLGPSCHVLCCEADTGEALWSIDLVEEYGAEVPEWYAGQCPLIDDGRVILAPGGDALMIAVDCATGEVLWRTPNPNGWKMTHASIAPATIAGRKMYLYASTGAAVGVDAATGELLWADTSWRMRGPALCATPVPCGDGRILLSTGYRGGSKMIRVTRDGDAFAVETLWQVGERVLGSEQQTPIFYRGHIYAVTPRGRLTCVDLEGRTLWDTSEGRKFYKGYGPYMIADGLLLVMGSNGLLVAAEATPAGYRELAAAEVVGKESWAPMALAGGRLLVRDINRLVCLDLRKRAGG
jgi:outer membrane protein assembly factor BamB